MKFTSNKVIDLGSAAFRQWRSTHSHCQYIHGYRLTADITFEADELDERNWVADFGGLKDLKKSLENTFDHKLVVAADDPHIDLLKMLDETGVAQVVVLQDGVGCEKFAAYVLEKADEFISKATEGRVRVKSVQINEHEKNFATAHRTADTLNVSISQSDSEPVDVDAIAAAEARIIQQLLDQRAIEAAEARINVIGKNGNDGEHYDSLVIDDVTADALVLEDNHGTVAAIDNTLASKKATIFSSGGKGSAKTAGAVKVVKKEAPKVEEEFKGSADQAAPVKPSTKTKGGWFEGTTWG